MSGALPKAAGRLPKKVEVVEGETYWFCTCGESANQPFCDGSHAGTAFEPLEFVAEEDGGMFFCMCKQSANLPYCDGSHGVM